MQVHWGSRSNGVVFWKVPDDCILIEGSILSRHCATPYLATMALLELRRWNAIWCKCGATDIRALLVYWNACTLKRNERWLLYRLTSYSIMSVYAISRKLLIWYDLWNKKMFLYDHAYNRYPWWSGHGALRRVINVFYKRSPYTLLQDRCIILHLQFYSQDVLFIQLVGYYKN